MNKLQLLSIALIPTKNFLHKKRKYAGEMNTDTAQYLLKQPRDMRKKQGTKFPLAERSGMFDLNSISAQLALCQRMVEVGRDVWRSSSPNLLLKQGHLQQTVLEHVQTASECL